MRRAARFVVSTFGHRLGRDGRLGIAAGLTAIAALSFLILLGHDATRAGASESVTCATTGSGPTGVLDVSVSGSATVGDSLRIVASGGEYSVYVISSGSPGQVCTTYSDSASTGYPSVEVTGTTLLSTDFQVGGDGDLTLSGQAGAVNTLDLSSLPTPVVVSVPAGTVTFGALSDSFTGIANFVGSASGDTAFLAGPNGGYTFTGLSVGNALDLSAATSGVTVSVSAGTVTGLTSGGDSFSGITTFVGSSSGSTTLAAGASPLTFTGQGTGNALDLSSAATSSSTPLGLNVSGSPLSFSSTTLANDTAAVGSTTYSFSDVSSFTGASSGYTTFFAGANGGYAFKGLASANTLDLSAAPAGTTATINDNSTSNPGVVTGLTSGTDTFSDIQHIVGAITATGPTVTNVSSTLANGSYGVGAVVPVTVTFSVPVTVTGTPRLSLNSGGVATYSSGTGTRTLTFTYVVIAGQNANPLEYASTSALSLNGGTIDDAFAIAASLTLAAPGASGSLSANRTIVIDTTAPTITITTPTDGSTYLLGQVVSASYGCADVGGAGVATCVGTVANASALDTSAVGTHSFSVNATDKAGNTSSKSAHYTVVYGFGGFLSPSAQSRPFDPGSTIAVRFTLTNASGRAIPASAAAQLAKNGGVEVVLSGPSTLSAQPPVLCNWNAEDQFFQCNLKTPARVVQGATYYLTVLVNVNGVFKAAPPYSSSSFDKNPVPITFKADRR